MSTRRIFVGICCLGLIAGCGASDGSDHEGDRPELTVLGGKADVPEWLKPMATLLGCKKVTPAPKCHTLDKAECDARIDCVWKTTPGFPGPISWCRERTIGPIPFPGPLASAYSTMPLQPKDKVNGKFKGSDSAHVYPFKARANNKITFVADYSKSKGAAIAIYTLNGKRIARDRNRYDNRASVEFEAEAGSYYLVAVYSVSWWATGNYKLTVDCAANVTCSPTGPIDALCGTICPAGYKVINGQVTCQCCDDTPQFCGGIGGLPCPAGQKCKLDGNYPDAGGKCVPKDYCDTDSDCKMLPIPMYCMGKYTCESNKCTFRCENPQPTCYVGGCSGQVCSDKPDVITTCEYRPEYQCLKYSQCGNNGPGGSCAWKKTPKYLSCMASL